MKAGLTAKQAHLLSDDAREILFGGAAGGGKSVGMLLAAAQYLAEPRYAALILRRTFKQLTKSDSILSIAKDWWGGRADVRYTADTYTFTFPGGSTLEFGHMEHEDAKYNYQGGAYRFVGFDELTQFTEPMYTYLFSRQRREAGVNIPLRTRATANPGGVGHDWVKRRFIDPQTRDPRAAFIPAKLADNPNLDRESYVESLSFLDSLTRQQLLAGDWDAVEGGRFRREWFPRYTQRGDLITLLRPGAAAGSGCTFNVWSDCQRFATVDPAASAKTSADYTVILVWAVSPRNDLVLLDAARFQAELPDQLPRLEKVYREWRLDFCAIEAVASNSGLFQLSSRTPMAVRRLNPLSQDKLVRATAAVVLCESGRVWLPPDGLRRGPIGDVEAEWYRFTGDDAKDDHDDCVDALSYSCKILTDGPSAADLRRAAPRIMGTGMF